MSIPMANLQRAQPRIEHSKTAPVYRYAKGLGPEFFAMRTVRELRRWAHVDLDCAGKLMFPMTYNASRDRYEVIEWAAALATINQILSQVDPIHEVSLQSQEDPVSLSELEFGSEACACSAPSNWARFLDEFSKRRRAANEFASPEDHRRQSQPKVLFCVGDELSLAPREITTLDRYDLTVHIASRLSAVHLRPGRVSFVLPCSHA